MEEEGGVDPKGGVPLESWEPCLIRNHSMEVRNQFGNYYSKRWVVCLLQVGATALAPLNLVYQLSPPEFQDLCLY